MKDEALPGSRMLVDLQADPQSQINVLAVDKSVLLLKSGNDITGDKVNFVFNYFKLQVHI